MHFGAGLSYCCRMDVVVDEDRFCDVSDVPYFLYNATVVISTSFLFLIRGCLVLLYSLWDIVLP